MSRRARFACLAASIFIALLANAADLPDKWRSWRYSRPVLQDSSVQNAPHLANLAEVRLPWELFAYCNAGLSDLRLIDTQGQEVPYILQTDRGTTRSESHQAHILENSFAVGKYTQIVGDLGPDAPFYDRVQIETPLSDFIVWAEVALSDDGKTWRIVESRAPIARFRKRAVEGTQTVSFQGLSSRYIRVRIFDAPQQFSVSGLTVLREESRPTSFAEVPQAFQLANSDDTTETAWTTRLSASRVPVSRLTFTTDTKEFYRAVRISGSDDGKIWNYRGSGVIFRYKQGSKIRESLSVDFPEWPENLLLRVDVINGNDQPLHNAQLSLLAVPRALVFKPQTNASYRLLYGDERAAPPQYDLGRYMNADPTASKPTYLSLSLGAEEVTSNYRDPRPFSEQHPEVLWIALGIAIVLIGLTALKTLRAPSPSPPGNPS